VRGPSRLLVGIVAADAIFTSAMSLGPALAGIYVRAEGRRFTGWEAYAYFWPICFMALIALAAIATALILVLDWAMGDGR
jgi:hypothetical protein